MAHSDMFSMDFHHNGGTGGMKESRIVDQPLVEEENEEDDPPLPPSPLPAPAVAVVTKQDKPAEAKPSSASIGIQVDMASLLEVAAEQQRMSAAEDSLLLLKAVPCTVRPGNAVDDASLATDRKRSVSQPPMLPSEEENSSTAKSSSPFSHASTLGEKTAQRAPWKKEVAKFHHLQKRVSQLIDSFDQGNGPATDELMSTDAKQRRRGSLQILDESEALDSASSTGGGSTRNLSKLDTAAAKQLRRKSTSAIMLNGASSTGEMNILGLTNILIESASNEALNKVKEEALKKEETPKEAEKEPSPERKSPQRPRPGKNWDYFEIGDHPKAISDKKLQQLKSKYQRRKTEQALVGGEGEKRKEGEERAPHPPPAVNRSMTVPANIHQSSPSSKELDLSIDPLTGECLGNDDGDGMGHPSGTADSGAASSHDDCSSNSGSSDSSRKSSRSSTRRRSSNLPDISEQSIPEEKVVEVRIDPLTGVVETIEVAKTTATKAAKSPEKQRLEVNVARAASAAASFAGAEDDGIGSLPQTPTDCGTLERPQVSAIIVCIWKAMTPYWIIYFFFSVLRSVAGARRTSRPRFPPVWTTGSSPARTRDSNPARATETKPPFDKAAAKKKKEEIKRRIRRRTTFPRRWRSFRLPTSIPQGSKTTRSNKCTVLYYH